MSAHALFFHNLRNGYLLLTDLRPAAVRIRFSIRTMIDAAVC